MIKIDNTKKYDVFGIGNAMMDFLIEVEHDVLDELKINKGQFKGISEEEMRIIFEKIEMKKFQRMPGGSTSNIIYGIAQLGGKVVFCGKVGKGDNAKLYEQKLIDVGARSRLVKSDLQTGKVLSFITPDSERSFLAFSGATITIVKDDIIEEDIKQSKILNIEGYILQSEDTREIAIHAIDIAKKHNVPVSVDLNDAGMIEQNIQFLKDIIKEKIDIIFVNEIEAEAFTDEKDLSKALDQISELSSIVVLKNGSKGSYIQNGKKIYEIPSYKANAIDTTGAGDMYAAGFLFGLTNRYDLETSGKIGSLAASKIVEQIGARFEGDLKDKIKNILDVKS